MHLKYNDILLVKLILGLGLRFKGQGVNLSKGMEIE